MGKKGQSSLEYMAVVGISLMLILGTSYYFFIQKGQTDKDVSNEEIAQLGNEIRKSVEDAYFSTGVEKKTLDITIPQEVGGIYVEKADKERFLVLEKKDGTVERISLGLKDVYSFFENGRMHSGKVRVVKIGDDVILCGLEDIEKCVITPEKCDDGIDNDLDRYDEGYRFFESGKPEPVGIDGEDWDCCPYDADGDGYTDPLQGGNCIASPTNNASDCDDTDDEINPGMTELCDDKDNTCNGITDDIFGCKGWGMDGGGLAFSEDGNGAFVKGQCPPGYKSAITLSAPTNAHGGEPYSTNNNFEYNLCYFTNPFCNLECNIEQGTTCSVGTKMFALYNSSDPIGTHIQTFNNSLYTGLEYSNSLCCEAACGQIECEQKVGADCDSDQSCILSMFYSTSSHAGSCAAGYDYPNKLCCRIDYG